MPPDEPRGGGPGGEPDGAWIEAWLRRAHLRWRVGLVAWHVIVGIAVALAVRAVLAPVSGRALLVSGVAGACVALAGALGTRGLRSRTPLVAAVEGDRPALGNALHAWHELGPSLTAAIERPLARQVRSVLSTTRLPYPVSARRWSLALAGLATSIALPWALPVVRTATTVASPDARSSSRNDAAAALHWQVTIRPPAYAGQPVQRLSDVTRVEALEGSRLDVRFSGWRDGGVVRYGSDTLALDDAAGVDLEVRQSDALIVSAPDGAPVATIVVLVKPDAAPDVRITAPGADLRRGAPVGRVPVRITARDDIGLREVRLRYTRVSGSGESFTFEDGEWPLRLHRRSGTEWEGEHVIDLAGLGLAPGDSIAYHAVAHDARPGASGAGESERFLIEIAREGAQVAGDFSLPEPEEKFALSQRMVIQLTERLLERRPRMTAEAYRGEAQALAIAQRRVRAEFVFMLGGEVQDEVEEAAHSHEVEAGRLDNRGQGDLTNAVRQMAQAEARLTDAALREALPYEYRALAALQAAFGQARYFMRTLPTPVQLDSGRRLTGDRAEATAARWTRAPLVDAERDRALALLARLEQPGTALAGVLPALIALDRANAGWVREVQGAVADDDVSKVTQLLRTRLLASGPSRFAVPLPASRDEASLALLERRP